MRVPTNNWGFISTTDYVNAYDTLINESSWASTVTQWPETLSWESSQTTWRRFGSLTGSVAQDLQWVQLGITASGFDAIQAAQEYQYVDRPDNPFDLALLEDLRERARRILMEWPELLTDDQIEEIIENLSINDLMRIKANPIKKKSYITYYIESIINEQKDVETKRREITYIPF